MAGTAGNAEVVKKEATAVEDKVTNGEKVTDEGEKTAKVDQEMVAKVEEMKVANKEEEQVKQDKEPKTGICFPVKLSDGKQLNAVGVRKKKVLALGVNIYAFGMYADNGKLKELTKAKFGKAPEKPTKELYEAVIDSDIGMTVRLVIVFGGLTMSLVRKSFDEGLGASLKKLNGGRKDEELVNRVMGAANDSIKLPSGSVIEITRFPGYVLQTIVKGELVSRVENELLCRAYLHMYLGDDPFDKEAKERFGASLLTLF